MKRKKYIFILVILFLIIFRIYGFKKDRNPNILLIVTADHETGGLELDKSYTATQLSDSLFTNGSESQFNHTGKNVLLYTYGKYADEIVDKDGVIDNTEICKFIKKLYGKKWK